jgi:hypothetical protein
MLTTARTLRLRSWVSHPNPPAWEWVTSTSGPMRSIAAEAAATITSVSSGPVSGTMPRKNCSSAAGSEENWPPSYRSGHKPSRNWLKNHCSFGSVDAGVATVVLPADPRRG